MPLIWLSFLRLAVPCRASFVDPSFTKLSLCDILLFLKQPWGVLLLLLFTVLSKCPSPAQKHPVVRLLQKDDGFFNQELLRNMVKSIKMNDVYGPMSQILERLNKGPQIKRQRWDQRLKNCFFFPREEKTQKIQLVTRPESISSSPFRRIVASGFQVVLWYFCPTGSLSLGPHTVLRWVEASSFPWADHFGRTPTIQSSRPGSGIALVVKKP